MTPFHGRGKVWAELVAAAAGAALLMLSAAFAAPDAGRGAPSAPIRQVQALEAEQTGLVAPMGLAFASASNSFHVLEAGPGAAPATTEVVRLTPFALTPGSDRAGSAQLAAAVGDPIKGGKRLGT